MRPSASEPNQRANFPAPPDVLLNIGGGNDAQLRPSVGGLASAVAAYDLISTGDARLTNAARRYFKSQPIATMSIIRVTGLHLSAGYRKGATQSR